MNPPEERRVVTAQEAESELGIPASSIRAWASKGRLFAVATDQKGRRWYRLSDVLELRDTTKRRTLHTRPARAVCDPRKGHIA